MLHANSDTIRWIHPLLSCFVAHVLVVHTRGGGLERGWEQGYQTGLNKASKGIVGIADLTVRYKVLKVTYKYTGSELVTRPALRLPGSVELGSQCSQWLWTGRRATRHLVRVLKAGNGPGQWQCESRGYHEEYGMVRYWTELDGIGWYWMVLADLIWIQPRHRNQELGIRN